MQTKMRRIQIPTGTHDILPRDERYYNYLKKICRRRSRQSGFKRIVTPVFEYSEVFIRPVGETSDIVQKEMYTFEDKSGKSLSLRPEGTAPVVRSYIENGMHTLPQPVELWYWEPMFRYSRPQKGRFRQFYQFGVEIIGEGDPAIDAQVILLGYQILCDAGLKDIIRLQVNSIGCRDCRPNYMNELISYYTGKERNLCDDCKKRLKSNPLRLLDCKAEDCRILAKLAPKQKDYLCESCNEHHDALISFLEELEIPYDENPTLVRGLDYYVRTVFEFWTQSEGAQNALLAGGAFDGLIELMGGPSGTPGIGFGMGIERVIESMKEKDVDVPYKDTVDIFVAQLGPEAKKKSLKLLSQFRDRGVKAMGAVGKSSMKAQLRLADKFNVKYCLILGEREVLDKTIIIREMTKGSQETVKMDEVIDNVIDKLGGDGSLSAKPV